MPHQMRYSVLTVALACVVLFRITPAVAWPWMERLHGTMWSFSQVVRLGTIDVPKADQGSREHSASAMAKDRRCYEVRVTTPSGTRAPSIDERWTIAVHTLSGEAAFERTAQR